MVIFYRVIVMLLALMFTMVAQADYVHDFEDAVKKDSSAIIKLEKAAIERVMLEIKDPAVRAKEVAIIIQESISSLESEHIGTVNAAEITEAGIEAAPELAAEITAAAVKAAPDLAVAITVAAIKAAEAAGQSSLIKDIVSAATANANAVSVAAINSATASTIADITSDTVTLTSTSNANASQQAPQGSESQVNSVALTEAVKHHQDCTNSASPNC